MKIRWRNLVDYERVYAISEYGKIKTIIGGQGRKKNRVMTPISHRDGYILMGLTINNNLKHFLLHRLVAATFIGPCPDGKEVNHKDGNKRNNHYSNLEYVSHIKNIRHSVSAGLSNDIGENNWKAKLIEDNVTWIKKQLRKPSYKHGNKTRIQSEIADKFNVSKYTIESIIYGKSWRHHDDD